MDRQVPSVGKAQNKHKFIAYSIYIFPVTDVDFLEEESQLIEYTKVQDEAHTVFGAHTIHLHMNKTDNLAKSEGGAKIEFCKSCLIYF